MIKLPFILLVLLATSNIALAQIEIYDSNVDEKLMVNDNKVILLDFYATWCAPCKQMDPILKELTREYPQVTFYKIDVDKNEFAELMNITAMPTYMFIKNSEVLYEVQGAMSKSDMSALLDYFVNQEAGAGLAPDAYDPWGNHGKPTEFSQSTINNLWDSWSNLNSPAWHAYEEHNEIDALLQAIKIVERSIAVDKNYYNVDTLAALYFKTGRYVDALKLAKEAINIAQTASIDSSETTVLMNKIIDKM